MATHQHQPRVSRESILDGGHLLFFVLETREDDLIAAVASLGAFAGSALTGPRTSRRQWRGSSIPSWTTDAVIAADRGAGARAQVDGACCTDLDAAQACPSRPGLARDRDRIRDARVLPALGGLRRFRGRPLRSGVHSSSLATAVPASPRGVGSCVFTIASTSCAERDLARLANAVLRVASGGPSRRGLRIAVVPPWLEPVSASLGAERRRSCRPASSSAVACGHVSTDVARGLCAAIDGCPRAEVQLRLSGEPFSCVERAIWDSRATHRHWFRKAHRLWRCSRGALW